MSSEAVQAWRRRGYGQCTITCTVWAGAEFDPGLRFCSTGGLGLNEKGPLDVYLVRFGFGARFFSFLSHMFWDPLAGGDHGSESKIQTVGDDM